MTPHYADDWLTIYGGDCRDVLATLPDESVHCVVTSPPYWGLRDYGTASWVGGETECDHKSGRFERGGLSTKQASNNGSGGDEASRVCPKCGARRVDNQLGLEPTPEDYVANMVAVFREVRRVLRDDGTLWLNLGDSYSSSTKGTGGDGTMSGLRRDGRPEPSRINSARKSIANQCFGARAVDTGLKPKDLVGIPWRVAFALQADGWYLRSDIIWAKPNPMPESVTDRPTKSHEYLFLLAKSPRYYFDADAVREPMSELSEARYGYAFGGAKAERLTSEEANGPGTRTHPIGERQPGAGRNIRSVWTIPTQPYPGAHFAVFPPKLVEPCIKAGTSERGVCAECGAPWRRVVERVEGTDDSWKQLSGATAKHSGRIEQGLSSTKSGFNKGDKADYYTNQPHNETRGWQPSCACLTGRLPVGAVVLDPFAGSGTVGVVAQRLSRRAVLIDLNPDYLKQQLERNAALPLGLSA